MRRRSVLVAARQIGYGISCELAGNRAHGAVFRLTFLGVAAQDYRLNPGTVPPEGKCLRLSRRTDRGPPQWPSLPWRTFDRTTRVNRGARFENRPAISASLLFPSEQLLVAPREPQSRAPIRRDAIGDGRLTELQVARLAGHLDKAQRDPVTAVSRRTNAVPRSASEGARF